MKYFFFSFTCLSLIIIQSSILPLIFKPLIFYDLIILFIIYIGLFHTFHNSIPVVLVIGIIMDDLSGAPFGMYISSYLWIFLNVRWLIRYLNTASIVILPAAVISGVIIENIIFLIPSIMADYQIYFQGKIFFKIILQLLFAILTGPFIIFFIHYFYTKCDVSYRELYRKVKENRIISK